MTLAGSIQVNLFHHAGHANQVQITSTRPDAAARVLLGKTPEQVLDIVPLLFSLCGNAQAYAALLACRAALGMVAAPEADAAQNLLVQLETLREHAWRILLDWPKLIGLSPNKTAIAALLKFDRLFKQTLFRNGEAFKLDSVADIDMAQATQLINELETLINDAIFNGSLGTFLLLNSEAQIGDWLQQNYAVPAQLLGSIYSQGWAGIGQNTIARLPELAAEDLHWQMQQYGLTAFVRTPNWLGCCFESTLLNRQLPHLLITDLCSRYGNGLLVRLVGRLLEVAGIPAQLRQLLGQNSANPTSPVQQVSSDGVGVGLAQVQAARGLLIHRLVLHQGQVYDYRIVAPTEWNFHPDGVVAHSLKQLQADCVNDLQRQAELLINAIDPCVQYQLNLIDSCNGKKIHA
ncbi:MAG: nickel-dependent hydrogenase large subunit [Methylococcaceae bacterium]